MERFTVSPQVPLDLDWARQALRNFNDYEKITKTTKEDEARYKKTPGYKSNPSGNKIPHHP